MRTSYTTLAILVLFLTYNLAGAQQPDSIAPASHLNEALRYELLTMRDEINGLQRTRFIIEKKYGLHSAQYKKASAQVTSLDKQHSARVLSLLAEHGWPGYSMVGQDGAHAIWMVVQRLDKEVLKTCAPLMTASALNGEADPFQAAVLQDRALLMNGKKQWYGTQLYTDSTTGKLEVFPVADEVNVDQRRDKIGLEPLAEYLQKYRIAYSKALLSIEMGAHAE